MKSIAKPTLKNIRQPANWVIAACFGLCLFSTARWLEQQPIALTPTADAAEITPQLDVPSPATGTKSKTVLTPIEDLEVGMRVRADSPNDEFDDQFGTEVVPSEWRKLTLTSPKKNGTLSHITLLRPLEWIEREKAVVDGHVYITVPECGIDGNARVHSIEPCPEIPDGEGQVITGTFRHEAEGGVELTIEGEPEAIRCTGNHPFWSEDSRSYTPADELTAGDELQTPSGTRAVRNIVSLSAKSFVFNIEVFANHTYHVGHSGVLVHNGDPKCNWGELFYDSLYAKLDDFKGARPWGDGRPGHPFAHYDELSIPHDVAKAEILDTLNGWSRSYAGIYPSTGRPVSVFWKDGHVVITEYANKHRVITSYWSKNKWATDRDYWEFVRRLGGWKGN